MVGGRHGTRLVVVVEEVVLPVIGSVVGGTLAAVAGIPLPVVHDVVEDGHGALLMRHVVMVDTRVPAVVVSQQVVVIGGIGAAPDSAVAVSTLAVSSVIKAFADGTPLHGEVVVVVK